MTKEVIEKYIQAIDGKSCATKGGGERDKGGAITMPWVDYDDAIDDLMSDFFNSDLVDYNYSRNSIGLIDSKNLDAGKIASMTSAEIGTCLTYIFRGERFCEIVKNL